MSEFCFIVDRRCDFLSSVSSFLPPFFFFFFRKGGKSVFEEEWGLGESGGVENR